MILWGAFAVCHGRKRFKVKNLPGEEKRPQSGGSVCLSRALKVGGNLWDDRLLGARKLGAGSGDTPTG